MLVASAACAFCCFPDHGLKLCSLSFRLSHNRSNLLFLRASPQLMRWGWKPSNQLIESARKIGYQAVSGDGSLNEHRQKDKFVRNGNRGNVGKCEEIDLRSERIERPGQVYYVQRKKNSPPAPNQCKVKRSKQLRETSLDKGAVYSQRGTRSLTQ